VDANLTSNVVQIKTLRESDSRQIAKICLCPLPVIKSLDVSSDFLLGLLEGLYIVIVDQLMRVVKAVAAPHRCLHDRLAAKVLVGGAQC
jgi:hypothetical protein